MSKKALLAFLAEQVKDAKAKGVLFSLHMKATMMKVSDPIIFGHAVKVFFAPVFEKFGDKLAAAGVNVNNGFGNLLAKSGQTGCGHPRCRRSRNRRRLRCQP